MKGDISTPMPDPRPGYSDYQALFTKMDQGFCVIEKVATKAGQPSDFRYVITNPAFERHTGLHNAVGKTIRELVPDAEMAIMDRYDEVAASGVAQSFEARVEALDLWIEAEAFATGVPNQVAVLFSNVSRHKRLETGSRETEERQAFLLKLSDTLRPLADPRAIEHEACRLLGEHLAVDNAHYVEINELEGWARVAQDFVRGDRPSLAADYSLSDFGWIVPLSRTGRVTAITDARTSPLLTDREQAAMEAIRVAGIAVAPLVKESLWVGALVVTELKPREWLPFETRLLEETGERIWASIERARAEAALRESEERQAFLLSLTDRLRTVDDAETVMTITAEAFGKRLGLAVVHFALFEDDEDSYTLGGAYSDGRLEVGLQATGRLSDHGPGWGPQFRAGEAVFSDDHETRGAADAEASRSFGIRSGSAVPLMREGRMVAIFSTAHPEPRTWTEAEKRLQREVAERTWAAVERARAEAALRDSEQRLNLAIEATHLGVWEWDLESDQVVANGRFREQWAVGPQEPLVAPELMAAIHPDDRSQVERILGQAMSPDSGGHYSMEYRLSGNALRDERWIAAEGQVHFVGADGDRRAARVLGTTVDISDRKRAAVERAQAEAASRKSEEQLRLIVESALDYAIFTTDEAGIIDNWLPGAESVFGWSKAEAEGQSTEILFTPEDRERGEAAMELATARREGKAPDVRWHLHQDGHRVFIEGQVVPLRGAGQTITGFLKIGRDATKRRAHEEALQLSEERFRQFGEASSDILWMRDPETLCWTYLTRAFEEIYGLRREEAMAGDNFTNWVELIVPEDRAKALANVERVRSGESVQFEYRIRRPDGQLRWLRDTDFPMFDGQEEVAMFGGIGQDVTALKRAEQHQRVLLAELQHRVRNTLAVVRSIARRTAENSSSVDDMLAHFQGRLDAFSRVQAALTRSADARVDLMSLIEDELVAHATREGSQLRIDGPEIALEPRTAERLSLAFHELTTNAVKHGALINDRGRIEISWKKIRRGAGEALTLQWIESGVELDRAGEHDEGFGMELLRRSLPYDLQGETTIDLRPTGLRFELTMPLKSNGEGV